MRKFQEGGKVTVDYFKSNMNGQMPSDPQEQAKLAKDADVVMTDRMTQWNDPETRKNYQKHFGTQGLDRFNEDYDKVQKNYAHFQSLLLQEKRNGFAEEAVTNIANQKWNNKFVVHTVTPDLLGREETMQGDLSVKQDNFRQAHIDSNKWMAPDGTLHDRTGDEVDNDKFKNENGKRIKGWVFPTMEEIQEEAQLNATENNGLLRTNGYLKPVYYGEEFGTREVVTMGDLLDKGRLLSTDVKDEGTAWSAIPRAIMGTAGGILSAIGSAGISVADLMDPSNESEKDDSHEVFERIDALGKSIRISVADASQESLFTWENTATAIADIGLQFLTMRGFGALGAMAARGVGAGLQATATTAKAAGLAPLILMATAESRDQAKAAGFTDKEAAIFNLSMLAGMGMINKAFSWMGDKMNAVQAVKEFQKLVNGKIALASGELVNVADNASRKGFVDKIAKSLFNDGKNFASKPIGKVREQATKLWTKLGDPMKNGIEESVEEFSEGAFEHINKGVFNVAIGEKDHEFMTTDNPEYWKQFWTQSGMSALGGFVGGASISAGEKFFSSKARSNVDRSKLVDVIMKGEGAKYLEILDDMHSKGLLGSTNLAAGDKMESMAAAGPGALSQNDANKQILLNEFNAIQTTIAQLGGTGMNELTKDDAAYTDEAVAGDALKRMGTLTKEYLDIKVKNPALGEAALNDIKEVSEEKRDEYIAQLAETYKVPAEQIERVMDIKKEMSEIKAGKYTEKFLMRKFMKDTLFDPKTPGGKLIAEKYGDKFLDNLMEGMAADVAKIKAGNASYAASVKLNDEMVARIKDDFSNISEIEVAINDGTISSLSKKAKLELAGKLSNFVQNPAIMNEGSKLMLQAWQEFSKESNLGKAISSIMEEHPELEREKVASFLRGFYGQYGTLSIPTNNSMLDLAAKALPDIKRAQDDDLVGFFNDSVEFSSLFSDGLAKALLTSDNTEALGGEAAKVAVENSMINNLFSISGANLSSETTHFFTLNGEPVKRVTKLLEKANELPDESTGLTKADGFHFVFKEFFGSDKKVSIGPEFASRIALLDENVEDSIINGVNYFSNLDETDFLLTQLRVKRDLIKGLEGLTSSMSSYNARLSHILSMPASKQSVQLLNDAMNDRNKFSKLIEEIWFNPDLFKVLKAQNDAGTLVDPLNKQRLEILTRTHTSIKTLTKNLEEDITKLEGYRAIAEANQGSKNMLANKTNEISTQVKDSVAAMQDFIETTSLGAQDNDVIPRFTEYYFKEFKKSNRTKEVLIKDQEMLEEVYEYLRQLPEDTKLGFLDEYYNTDDDEDNLRKRGSFGRKDQNLKNYKRLANFNRIAINSFFDGKLFYDKFRSKMEAFQFEIPTSQQEEVALTVAAHLNTDLANNLQPFINEEYAANKRLKDTLVTFGAAGTGKSTFALGYGLSIGQSLMPGGSLKNKVLLASKGEPQIETIVSTATKFKIELKTVPGSAKGSGLKTSELIEYLKLAEKGSNFLDDVSVIAYDEATFLSYRLEDIDADDKSELGQIMHSLEKINETRRKSGRNPIKLVLTGDNKQSGFVSEDGVEENIGRFGNKAFRTMYLGSENNHRAKLPQITRYGNLIKSHNYMRETLTNVKPAVYGKIGKEDNALMGGVQIVKNYDKLNDDLFIEHLTDMIKAAKMQEKSKNFVIAVVSNKGFPKTKLDDLINNPEFKESFKIFNRHEDVQGFECDYVICDMDVESFKNDRSEWGADKPGRSEKIMGQTLATTIERARYYTLVINNTRRNLPSEPADNLSISNPEIDKLIVEKAKEFRTSILEFIPNQDDKINVKEAPAAQEEAEVQEAEEVFEEPLQTEMMGNAKPEEEPEPATSQESSEVVGDEEYDSFVNNNEVSEERINDIAEKVKNNEPLTPRELAVFSGKTTQVNDLIAASYAGTAVVEDSDVDDTDPAMDMDPRDLEVMGRVFNDVLSSSGEGKLNNEEKGSAEQIAMLFHKEKDLLTSYPNKERNFSRAKMSELNQERSFFKDSVLVEDPNEHYELQLQAINDIRHEAFKFKYSLLPVTFSAKTAKGNPFEKVELMLLAEKDGKGIVVSSLFIPIKDGGSRFMTHVLPILKERAYSRVELGRAEMLSLVGQITNGPLVRDANKTTLSKLKDRLAMTGDVTISKDIFVTTQASSENRGDAFIFYTFNDRLDITSEEAVKRLMTTPIIPSEVEFQNGGNPIKLSTLPNGLGVIRLDTKPISFTEFYNQNEPLIYDSENPDPELVKMVIQNKGSVQMAGLFAGIRVALDRERGVESSLELSELLNEPENEGLFKNMHADIMGILRKLKLKNEKLYNEFVDFVVTSTDNLGERRVTDEGKHILSWGGLPPGMMGYAPQDGDDKRIINFRVIKLMNFIRHIDNSKKEEVLGLVDSLLATTKKFEKGLYIRPSALKKDYDNKVFAKLPTMENINLDDFYTTTVKSIDLPILRMNVGTIESLFSKPNTSKTKVTTTPVAKLAPSVVTSAEVSVINDAEMALSSNAAKESIKQLMESVDKAMQTANFETKARLKVVQEKLELKLDSLSEQELDEESDSRSSGVIESIKALEHSGAKDIFRELIVAAPFAFSMKSSDELIQMANQALVNYSIENLGNEEAGIIAKVQEILQNVNQQVANQELFAKNLASNMDSKFDDRIPYSSQSLKITNSKGDLIELVIQEDGSIDGFVTSADGSSNGEIAKNWPTLVDAGSKIQIEELGSLYDKLAFFHALKSSGVSTGALRAEILEVYDTTVQKNTAEEKEYAALTQPTQDLNKLIQNISSARQTTLRQKEKLQKAFAVINKINKNIKTIRDGLSVLTPEETKMKLGEFLTAGDVELIIREGSLTSENLGDKIGDGTQKILNSTWRVAKKLLSLEIGNAAEIDLLLNSEPKIQAMKKKVEEIASLMSDKARAQEAVEVTNELIAQVQEKAVKAKSAQEVVQTMNPTIASVNNMIPLMANNTPYVLSNGAREAINKFSMNGNAELVNFYTEFLNGKWSNPLETNMNALIKNQGGLFSTLKAIANNPSVFDEIRKYITAKSKESSCI
jgi:hypothetical protein